MTEHHGKGTLEERGIISAPASLIPNTNYTNFPRNPSGSQGLQNIGSVKSTGWICPTCKSVWGPHIPGCFTCNNKVDTTQRS